MARVGGAAVGAATGVVTTTTVRRPPGRSGLRALGFLLWQDRLARPRTVGWPAMTWTTPAGDATATAASLQEEIDRLMQAMGPRANAKLARDLLSVAAALATDDVDRLDLKIATAALTEMRDAFRVFAPYQDVPKVTIFGSARTRPDDPVYEQARRIAADLAEQGWMVVTGAGPGIMAAGMEGAGRERSIGVSIRLPWEQSANSIIAGDHKYVSMKYFFTRKLMLIKESKAFVCLPGGFGTLDETYELLTLTQTGKGLPVPIVFLDTPGDTYWRSVGTFIDDELVSRGLVSSDDVGLFLVTDDCEVAAHEIQHFYANYQSLRYVGDELVIRTEHLEAFRRGVDVGRQLELGELRHGEAIQVVNRDAIFVHDLFFGFVFTDAVERKWIHRCFLTDRLHGIRITRSNSLKAADEDEFFKIWLPLIGTF
jgi:hypothetical protein